MERRMNRRQALESAAGIAAVSALAGVIRTPAFAASEETLKRAPEETARDEDFWTAVRNEFTTDRTVINLNNGHFSPAPRTVQEAMRRYLDYSRGSRHDAELERIS